jgi:hypothetical protein
MSDTSQDIEREVEARRAGVERTLDKLKNRLSVDQLVDEVGQFVGMDDVKGTLRSAGRQVRENPLALGLIGAGLAWLVLGSKSGSDDRSSDERFGGRYSGASPVGHGADYDDSPAREASHLAGKVGSKVQHAAGSVKDYAGDAAHRMREAVDDSKDQVMRAVRPVAQRLENQPLLLGSVAVVVGAVVGSALPRTKVENRLLGPQKHMLMEQAKSATREVRDRAVETAKASYGAAVETAQDEGLLPTGDSTIAERLEHVAKAAVDEAKAHVDPEMADAEEAMGASQQGKARNKR